MKTWRTIRNILIGLILVALIVLPSGNALSSSYRSPAGAFIEVNTYDDDFDPAEDFDDSCSLREAIYTAMYDSNYGGCSHTGVWGSDTVSLPEGEFDLTIPGIEDAGIAGDLDIYLPPPAALPRSIQSPFAPPTGITIQGDPTTYSIINAHGIDRVFHILAGVSVHLEHLMITGGYPAVAPNPSGGGILNYGILTTTYFVVYNNSTPLPGYGGGIYNQGTITLGYGTSILSNSTGSSSGATSAGLGGGIYNAGTLTATDSLILLNKTGDNNGTGTAGEGAGIFNSGTGHITLDYVTISENGCGARNANHGARGGGIFNLGMLTINTSTISSNMAGSVMEDTGDYNGGPGGGIFNLTGGILSITDSTIANNYSGYSSGSGASEGGGLVNWGGSATLENTLLADNFANDFWDCSGDFVSGGYNLVEDPSGCTITGDTATNITYQDPRLAPLGVVDNRNYMHRLLLDSPAIDAGPNTCNYIDQRHLSRPKDGNGDGTLACDIGAYEAYLWSFIPLIKKP